MTLLISNVFTVIVLNEENYSFSTTRALLEFGLLLCFPVREIDRYFYIEQKSCK